jgi:hypothetical protein
MNHSEHEPSQPSSGWPFPVLANWPARAREMDELEDAGSLPDRNRFVLFIIPWMQLVASVPRIIT